MSEASIVTLVGAFFLAVPPTLLALASLIQIIRTARKVAENTVLTDVLMKKTDDTEKKVDVVSDAVVEVSKKTDDQTLKIDSVNTKAEVIAGHVNSEKTAGQGREATLTAENKLLREMMVVLERSAASVAQARPTIQVLEKIDEHAKQIEHNTANIETQVEALRNGS